MFTLIIISNIIHAHKERHNPHLATFGIYLNYWEALNPETSSSRTNLGGLAYKINIQSFKFLHISIVSVL